MEESMYDIDFDKIEPQLLAHESQLHLASEILSQLKKYDLRHHFILFSSGTTGGDLKGYAISKEALFTNADAVNKHFNLNRQDISGLSLPTYHIGGLSVLARADLLGNKVVDARKWNPDSWHEKMDDVSITTVVPTQMYDLVQRKLKPSKNLRYIIVGGDLLSTGLKDEAMKLGWPVIRTFGMSEVCSQLASAANPESDELEVLPIHQVKTDENKRLLVKSEALFTLQFKMGKTFEVQLAEELCDKDGFYKTSDRADIHGKTLRHLGRIGDEFKIAGHLVNFNTLRNELSSYLVKHDLYNQMEFSLQDDPRKGKKLVLLSLQKVSEMDLTAIAKLIAPVKIDEVQEVSSFERTALGKLKKV